jgi:hypothetical protein
MKAFRFLLLVCSLLPIAATVWGDAGVLIPSSDSDKPDPAKLSLDDMRVSILVDNQNATSAFDRSSPAMSARCSKANIFSQSILKL